MRELARLDFRSPASHCQSDQEESAAVVLSRSISAGSLFGRAPESSRRTGLLRLPDACPWTIDEIISDDFLP